jgi:hypothetical protein
MDFSGRWTHRLVIRLVSPRGVHHFLAHYMDFSGQGGGRLLNYEDQIYKYI